MRRHDTRKVCEMADKILENYFGADD